jgi:hypothetical protein
MPMRTIGAFANRCFKEWSGRRAMFIFGASALFVGILFQVAGNWPGLLPECKIG